VEVDSQFVGHHELHRAHDVAAARELAHPELDLAVGAARQFT
jgi:hypothetical protein